MRAFIFGVICCALNATACGESSKDSASGGSTNASGGATNGGSSTATGGDATTNGGTASGGSAAGGTAGSDTGGSSSAGTGGSGANSASGGNLAGGTAGKGGSSATGGTAGKGGGAATGGTNSTGGSGGGSFDIGSSVPLDQLATAVAKVRCAIDLRCGLAFSKVDAGACVERATGFDPIVGQLEELASRNKLKYDPTRMAACLGFLRNRACDAFGHAVEPGSPEAGYTDYLVDATLSWAANADCRSALLGDGSKGGGCYTASECASGICEIPAGTPACGRCVEPLARGATCVGGEVLNGSYFDRCGLDDYCDPQTNRCVARLARGAACGDETARACALGLKCVTAATGGSGTCQGFAAEGQPCASLGVAGGAPCANWLYCGSTCRRGVGPLGTTGDTCAGGELCLPGLVCDGTKCRAPSQGNTACYSGVDPDACVAGFYCDWQSTAGTCKAEVAAGKSCTLQEACANDLACLSETSVCGAKKAADAACSTLHGGQGECAAPLQCLGSTASAAGTCKALAELDEACVDSSYCAPGLTCMSGSCKLAGLSYLGCP